MEPVVEDKYNRSPKSKWGRFNRNIVNYKVKSPAFAGMDGGGWEWTEGDGNFDFYTKNITNTPNTTTKPVHLRAGGGLITEGA
jgi:hypothetical protein